jgi:hypothetical protein
MVNDQSLEDTELELTEKELILYIFNEFKKNINKMVVLVKIVK